MKIIICLLLIVSCGKSNSSRNSLGGWGRIEGFSASEQGLYSQLREMVEKKKPLDLLPPSAGEKFIYNQTMLEPSGLIFEVSGITCSFKLNGIRVTETVVEANEDSVGLEVVQNFIPELVDYIGEEKNQQECISELLRREFSRTTEVVNFSQQEEKIRQFLKLELFDVFDGCLAGTKVSTVTCRILQIDQFSSSDPNLVKISIALVINGPEGKIQKNIEFGLRQIYFKNLGLRNFVGQTSNSYPEITNWSEN